METTIKWYGDLPIGWYVEQSNNVKCEVFSNNDLSIHHGWVLTKLNKSDDKEVYFKKFLIVTMLGYREFWKHNNDIATRVIQYAVITPYTRHKTLPYVIIETESLYAPVLFRELQRHKRKLDFFREIRDEQAWQELITCAKEANSTYSKKYLNYTFYSNKTPLWAYQFMLSVKTFPATFNENCPVRTMTPYGAVYVPRITHYSDISKNEATSYEQAALIAAQHGFSTEFPREHGTSVVDFQDVEWCKFACAFD